MKVITVDGISIVVGLTWVALTHDNSRSASKAQKEALAKHKGSRFGVRVEEGLFRAIGLAPPEVKKAPKEPSGAALIALANQNYEAERAGQGISIGTNSQSAEESNWILVENAGPSSYWILITKEGLPLPGSDLVCSREEMLEIVGSMLEDSSQFVVHSPDEDVRQSVSLKARTSEKGFKELISSNNVKLSKGMLKQVSGIPSLAITIILTVAVIAGLGFGYQYLVKKQRAAAAAAAAAANQATRMQMEAQERANYEGQVRVAVLTALDQGEAAVNMRLASPYPDAVVAPWVNFIHSLPSSWNGWDIDSVSCMMEPPGSSCSVTLSRGQLGINRLLNEVRPDAKIEGDAAVYKQTFETRPSRSSETSRLPTPLGLSVGLISDLQLLKTGALSYTASASKEIEQPVSLPPPPKSIFKPGRANPLPKVDPIKMGVAVGTLTIKGPGLWQMDGFEQLAHQPSLSLTKMSFQNTSGSDWTWTADFEYMVRTADAPTLPVVVIPENILITVELPEKYRNKSSSSSADKKEPKKQQ